MFGFYSASAASNGVVFAPPAGVVTTFRTFTTTTPVNASQVRTFDYCQSRDSFLYIGNTGPQILEIARTGTAPPTIFGSGQLVGTGSKIMVNQNVARYYYTRGSNNIRARNLNPAADTTDLQSITTFGYQDAATANTAFINSSMTRVVGLNLNQITVASVDASGVVSAGSTTTIPAYNGSTSMQVRGGGIAANENIWGARLVSSTLVVTEHNPTGTSQLNLYVVPISVGTPGVYNHATVDANNNIYFSYLRSIWKYTPSTNVMQLFAGDPAYGGGAISDGTGTNARFNNIISMRYIPQLNAIILSESTSGTTGAWRSISV